MQKIELLAPCGNMESFYAALLGGCDAVYLAGYEFGARKYAGNFSMEELQEVIQVAHLYGVKVYITVNTMIYESEVVSFLHYIDELVLFHPDALIIEDIGMFDLIHQRYPDLELHASTQMHLHNQSGVQFAKQIGFQRAVIARETPIEEIKKIRQEVDLPLEVFCHGALCISYSGQCLMSSMIGGRSGNRGTCTQCCRLPYQLETESGKQIDQGYLLSTRDLNTLEYIGELIEAGVDSIKIEGRMKRPEYVYYVTSLYRKAIDSYLQFQQVKITEEEIKNLKKIFHRKFTKGFLFHDRMDHFSNPERPNHIGIPVGKVISFHHSTVQIKLSDSVQIHDGLRILGKKDVGTVLNEFYRKNQRVYEAKKGEIITFKIHGSVSIGDQVVKTTDAALMQEIQQYLKESKRKVPIMGTCICHIGQPLQVTVTDQEHTLTITSKEVLQKAKTRAVTKQELKQKLAQLNDTVYTFQELKVVGEEGFIPMSKINAFRREMVEQLNQVRLERKAHQKQVYQRERIEHQEKQVYKTGLFYEEETYQKDQKKFEQVYLEEPLYQKYCQDPKVILKLDSVMTQYPACENTVLISEYGSLMHYSNFITNHTFNIANSYAVRFLEAMGAKRVTVSLECSTEQIKDIYEAYQKRYQQVPPLEVVIETRPLVMTLKYPLLKQYGQKKGFLVQNHEKYPVLQKEEITQIYFSREIQRKIPEGISLTTRVER